MSDVTGQPLTAPSRGPVSSGHVAVAARGRIAILIVSWNARDLLLRCLASLASLPHHVIVVDNDSEDGSADAVAQRFPEVTLVRSATNLGFAGGVNRARREAGRGPGGGFGEGQGQQVDHLLLLNPDTVATGEAIDTLSAVLAGDPGVGAVGGRLVYADGSPQRGFNVRRFPTLGSFAMDLLLVDQVWPDNPWTRRYLARDLDDGPGAAPTDVDQPAAACLMVRADAFDAIGGMDERFHPAWFEDVDFCRRLVAAGYRIRFEPRATFEHQGGVAMRTLGLRRFSSIWYANMERYVRRHHGTAGWLLLKGLIAAGMSARVAISLLRRDPGARQAYTAVLKQTATRWHV
jgi:N-acetylglucosaminyl-diphospho-decaprenol L-rhamnosyltransferase